MRRLFIIAIIFPLLAKGQVAYRSGLGVGIQSGMGIWGTSIPQVLPTEKIGTYNNIGIHLPLGNYGYLGLEKIYFGNSFISDTNSLKPYSNFQRWSIPLIGMIPLDTKIPLYFSKTGRPKMLLEISPTIGGEFIYDRNQSFSNLGENPWNNSLVYGITFSGARPAYHNRSMESNELKLSFLIKRIRNSNFVSPKSSNYSVFSIFSVQITYSIFHRFNGGRM